MRYEVYAISCGVETLLLTTRSQNDAARFYRHALNNQACVRIRANGRQLTITEADKMAFSRKQSEKAKAAKPDELHPQPVEILPGQISIEQYLEEDVC